MAMSQLRVLVVGASIAGPTTAYWLAKAGAHVTVIERFPALRKGGQNIDIRTAGVTVMRKMAGMEAAVRAKRVPIDGLSLMHDNGRPYGTFRATGNPDQQSLLSEYEIFRGDLSQILFDMTNSHKHIQYVFGEQVTAIRQHHGTKDEGPVTVEFANGSPAAEYDLVVAADGATSRTRAIGLGGGVRDHIKPTNSWAAYFSIDEDFLDGSRFGQGYSTIGGRFCAIGPDLVTSGSRVALIAMQPSAKGIDMTRPFREALKQGDEGDALKLFVARHFHGAGWKTEDVLRKMMESKDFYASEVVQVKAPHLRNGRFVLVGDAGYAPGFTGTGTTLALVGSYVLAGEIAKHRGDLAAGLRGYEERMSPIIKEMQKTPPLVQTFMAPQTAWGVWLRNYIFAFIAWTKLLELAQSLFGGGALGNADKYPLPEYEWPSERPSA